MSKPGPNEVAQGIHRIELPLGDRMLCLFLLIGEKHCMLLDTGLADTPASQVVPYLEAAGLSVDRLDYALVTHADLDHSGGDAGVKEIAPHVCLMCHELDRLEIEDVEWMIDKRYGQFEAEHDYGNSEEVKQALRGMARHAQIDIALAGGEKMNLGAEWRVDLLHTPGHSRGHMTVYDPRSRCALISDAVLLTGLITRTGAPAFPPTYRYVDTYLATIQRLQGMDIEVLLTGHYPVYRGPEVADFLAESRGYVERVDTAVRDELRRSRAAIPTKALVSALVSRLGEWPPAGADASLAWPVIGHLERLNEYGLVTKERVNGLIAWRWAG